MRQPPDRNLAREGLQVDFLSRVQSEVQALILPMAEAYFREGGDAFTQESQSLKPIEKIVNYYDYQPCAVSVLGLLAAQGSERALVLVRRIFENVRYYIDDFRAEHKQALSLRRAQFHLALCYDRLRAAVPSDESEAWRDLLTRTAEDMLEYFNGLQERTTALDNRAFGTGINHVAIVAEGIWKSGDVLDRPDWQKCAGDFIDRLVAYSHPDGYFEENTNDAREGGPSLAYTPLTAGCAYMVQRWRGNLDRERFARCGVLYRNLTDTRLQPLVFTDERANPQGLRAYRPYGRALHSLTREGRGFLRMSLDPETGQVPLGALTLEHLARLHLEIDHMEPGEGALPEPFHDGAFRIRLPLGVVRKNGWTMGLSALRALNREIRPKGDYALDRQSLLCLVHETAGTVLAGAKSKYDPLWSTVRIGDDAYPVRTGNLKMEADRAVAEVFYETFSAEATWIYGEHPRLVMASDAKGPLKTQLVLEIPSGTHLSLDGGRSVEIGEEEAEYTSVCSVATDAWEVSSDREGCLIWHISLFNPYSAANKSAPDARRPVFIVEWTEHVEFSFRAIRSSSD